LRDGPTRALTRRRGLDRITLSRCNRTIELLSDQAQGGKKLAGRAWRAHAILRAMEALLDNEDNDDGCGISTGGNDDERFFIPPMSIRDHDLDPPIPDSRTYFLVLRLYGTANNMVERDAGFDHRSIPRRIRAILDQMEKVAKIRSRSRKLSETTTTSTTPDTISSPSDNTSNNEEDLRPNVVSWNQLLLSWSNSDHPDRARNAVVVLHGDMKDADVQPDQSSYLHALRTCASYTKSSSMSYGRRDDGDAARLMAHKVALHVIERLRSKETDIVVNSYLHSFALQSLGLCLNLEKRDLLLRRQFEMCCADGMVNAFILVNIWDLASERLVFKLLGKSIEVPGTIVKSSSHSLPKVRSPAFVNDVLRRLPSHWTYNANITKPWKRQ